jgi:uncharacterized membrane protein
MSDQNRVQLSDQEKIDRAAFHEQVRFYKKQQWAVATAGVVLLGAFLATVNDVHMTALDKFLAVVLIALGVCAGGYFLDNLQTGLTDVRRRLDFSDHDAAIRGRDIMNLHKAILVGSALVVVWAVFKLP